MANRKLPIIILITLIILGSALAYILIKGFNAENKIIYYKPNDVENKYETSNVANNNLTDQGIDNDNYATTEASNKNHEMAANDENSKINNGHEQVMTVLFLGIDRTEERDETIGIFRSDTIMIARINITDKKMKILSIPRDTYTYIPIRDKKDKINHAYAYGSLEGKGVSSVIKAIENFIEKIKIDNYFSLEMEPFPNIIDDIGGVELDVEIDMKTHGADLSKGYQLLDGKKAFDYIHWRYSPNGDIGRIERQHKFIRALIDKINNSDEPEQYINILLKYMDYYETDLTIDQIKELITSFKGIKGENIQFYSIPGKDQTINGIWYWVPDSGDMEKVLADFFS